MVRRYKEYRDSLSDCFCEMEEDGAGEWVAFEDYKALREAAILAMNCKTLTEAAQAKAALQAALEGGGDE